jgi:hypothetical protein
VNFKTTPENTRAFGQTEKMESGEQSPSGEHEKKEKIVRKEKKS